MKIYKIKVNGKSYRVELEAIEQVDTAPLEEKKKQQESKKIINNDGAKEVVSPFEGQVAEILVTKGQNVKAKEPIIIIE